MTTGYPPQPTFRSILAGIFLVILILFALLHLGIITKYIGAVFMFLPNKLGLVDMVYPQDVKAVDFSHSPTAVDFTKKGEYLLYTNNYDLLVVHDSVLGNDAPPWLNVLSDNGETVKIEMIERGLILFDTPFADGRPVLRLAIPTPGQYQLKHPTRATNVYLVPDYLTGKVEFLTLLLYLQLAIFGYPLYKYGYHRFKVKRDERRVIQEKIRARIEGLRKKTPARKSEEENLNNNQNIWRPKR